MFNDRWKWLWLALALLMAFGVPASMVFEQEQIRSDGVAVKIRTRPIDPYDPFRGRYVRLGFDVSKVPLANDIDQVRAGERVHLSLAVDEEGYGVFGAAHLEEPPDGLYVTCRVSYTAGDGMVFVNLPFDRYYMNEEIAPEAERLYLEANRRRVASGDGPDAFPAGNYALVRIRGGAVAIEAVFLEDQPIEQYARDRLKRAR